MTEEDTTSYTYIHTHTAIDLHMRVCACIYTGSSAKTAIGRHRKDKLYTLSCRELSCTGSLGRQV